MSSGTLIGSQAVLRHSAVAVSQVGTLNYMPPEAIRDTSSKPGTSNVKCTSIFRKAICACVRMLKCICFGGLIAVPLCNPGLKCVCVCVRVRACFHPQISPKGDVWSLGCILYCMTYGRTPFQSITNQFAKLHAIIDPRFEINFPNMA